jgi:xanthine/CO dehydrogenase XdhC/CoxF family maturation factor
MFEQKNRLEIYDTSDEEDNNLGVQLGCNGIVYILFEPINNDDPNHQINLLKQVAFKRVEAILITLFNPDKNNIQKGTGGFINETESFFKEEEMKALKPFCMRVLDDKLSMVNDYKCSGSVLLQFIAPAIQLVIVGAGNDAQPLMSMAYLLGWNIVVIDGRPAYITTQRFAKAGKTALSKSTEILQAFVVDEQTAVVLMTHNYNYDIEALEQLLYTDCNYVGVLGPKKKLHKMFDELTDKGIEIDEDKVRNIYGPVGLDIGAETSEEIALSIIAEIKAVFSKRKGTFLKERTAAIHNRS